MDSERKLTEEKNAILHSLHLEFPSEYAVPIIDRTFAAALSYAEQKREGEGRAALKILASYYEAMSRILPNVAQLLDGWHQDGTAWTEWDESVRRDVSLLLEMVEVLRKRIEEVQP